MSPASASTTFQESLVKNATESAWKSFTNFSQRFITACETIDDRNRQFVCLSYKSPDPHLSDNVSEFTDIVNLLQTCGNMELNKLILVFAELTREMNQLAETGMNEFISPIILYGCSDRNNGSTSDEEDLISISNMLPLLNDLLCFTNRCLDLAVNWRLQLEALYTSWKRADQSISVDVNGIRFDILFDSLAKLSLTLLTLDMALASNSLLKNDLIAYKRMIELATGDASQFQIQQTDQQKLKVLRELISIIERDVMDSFDDHRSGYKSFFSKLTESLSTAGVGHESKNTDLVDQFSNYIKNSLQEYDLDTNRLRCDNKWLSIICMFVHYVWMFKRDDKRVLKMITDSQKKTGSLVCHLSSNISVFPDHLLLKKLPKGMLDKRIVDNFNSQRDAILSVQLDKEYKSMKQKLMIWLVSFEKEFSRTDQTVSIVSRLATRMQLLEDAYEHSIKISLLIRSCIHLHLHHEKAVSKKDIGLICRLVNLLKSIEISIERKKAQVLLFQSAFSQYHSCVALKSLNQLKKRLVADVKKYSEKKLDMISAVILASNCFHGPILTSDRQIITSLCMSLIVQCMNDVEMMKILPSFDRIVFCSEIITRIKSKTKCDFLFFNRSAILPVYFSQVEDVRDLVYFFTALNDSKSMIDSAHVHEEEDHRKTKPSEQFASQTYAVFENEYLNRLCMDFETELRLQTHLDLQLEDQSPFKRKMRDFTGPLKSQPIRLFDRLISIPDHVADHLNQMSYNLTTIALHDWKTYESMLNLARVRYGLSFVKSQLPTQTVEQGLDVLEITRNIHLFVTRYSYNLNNQIFVERSSDNKHLNVLHIRHVANSIQTHGYGIINTAVNFTYQFLRKKFNDFSQFLFEEHVKSRLIKDLRNFREQKSSGTNMFSYERAEKFVKGIRKLGLTSDGHSYLDKFRIIITEIGNALGFVRMLRSGALHCSSSSVNFIPDLDDLSDISFNDLCQNETFEGEVLVAAQNLDSILSTLNRNFSEATDYFKLLVDVFANTLRDSKNSHLKNMFVVMPALSVSHVEHMIVSKEKMNRKNSLNVAFTDDGFAVGLAYILRLLDQVSDFESLHWFQSVRHKVTKEKKETEQQSTQTSTDERFSQTTSLTLKRLSILQKEFDLLEYNMTSSKILFRE